MLRKIRPFVWRLPNVSKPPSTAKAPKGEVDSISSLGDVVESAGD